MPKKLSWTIQPLSKLHKWTWKLHVIDDYTTYNLMNKKSFYVSCSTFLQIYNWRINVTIWNQENRIILHKNIFCLKYNHVTSLSHFIPTFSLFSVIISFPDFFQTKFCCLAHFLRFCKCVWQRTKNTFS